MPNNSVLDQILASGGNRRPNMAGISQTFVFNRPIPRTGDLLNSNILSTAAIGAQFRPNFFVAAPPEAMNRHAVSVVEQLAATLSLVDEDNNLAQYATGLSLGSFLERITADNGTNALQQALLSGEAAGSILSAVEMINAKTLEPTDRFLLSKEPILIYILFLLTEGMDISDEEVIVSNIVPALRRVRAYVNREVAEPILRANRLDIGDSLTRLQNDLEGRVLSYQQGQLETTVIQAFEQASQSGPLEEDVRNFLQDQELPIPDNLSRDELIQSMVNFISSLGIDDLPDDDSSGGSGTDPGDPDPGGSPIQAVDFDEAIKGIGNTKAQQLVAGGILTYAQLASISEDDLGAIITPQSPGYTLADYIQQAQFIVQGQFQELLDFQNTLPRSANDQGGNGPDPDDPF